MSGIVAVYRADGRPVDGQLVARMSRALAHRGPDGARQWVDGAIGLGHRLLHTTPESLDEVQPVADARGEQRLVWDGRIDNREELTAALRGAGRPLPDRTDPGLALAAYQEWGTGCAARVLGDFAFVLWDGTVRRLVCARDRLGLKPLHYAWDGLTLLVSSEIKPLLDAQGAPEPDDEMVLAFLLREFREADHERTFYRGIRRLPPGHLMLLQDGRLRIERYWAIDPARETLYAAEEEYADHFLSLFRGAVRCRTRSAFPIGIFLSGGLDSSAIACVAGKLADDPGGGTPPLEAFTLFADQPASDERRYAREVVRAAGLKAHEIAGRDPDPLDGLDDAIWQVESPIVAATREGSLARLEVVRARGCRVLLSGEGGDQLLDELGYLADLLRTLRPVRFVRETRAFARWYDVAPRRFAELAIAACLPPSLKFWGKRIARRAPPSWINARLAREIGLGERIREPRQPARFPSATQSETHLGVSSPYYLLKREVDERVAARWGVELRYPFLDSRLVEFVLSIPWARRTRDGERKRLLRAAMRGIVPEPVRRRQGKSDWTDPMDQGLTALCRRSPPVPLENRSRRMQRYLDLPKAGALVARYLGGARDLRWEVWFLVTVDRWLDKFWRRS